MKVLSDFITYLAQAHCCAATGVVPFPVRTSSNLHHEIFTATKLHGAANEDWTNREPAAFVDVARTLLAYRIGAAELCATAPRDAGALVDAFNRVPAAVVFFEHPEDWPPPKLKELASMVAEMPPAFFGMAPEPMRGSVAVFDRSVRLTNQRQPRSSFRVLAIMPTYNEEDVIAQTLNDLIKQGLDIYLLDNWSTDKTIERAEQFKGKGLVCLERFPPEGPTATYNLAALLCRVEQIAEQQSWASWVMLHDADERRRSPWLGVSLRDALWRVDQSGFSCIDHVTLNFWPVDDSFDPQHCDLEQHFTYFEFSNHPGHFHQRRAWKQMGARVSLAESAGHDVRFASRRVYPYKFVLKHYPVRSQAHGERKVRRERGTRWNADERARGWHRQYDENRHSFLRDPRELIRFEDGTFWNRYLVQRLSGAGIFTEPPPWATPPRW